MTIDEIVKAAPWITSDEILKFEEQTNISFEDFLQGLAIYNEMMNDKILMVMNSQLEGARGVDQSEAFQETRVLL